MTALSWKDVSVIRSIHGVPILVDSRHYDLLSRFRWAVRNAGRNLRYAVLSARTGKGKLIMHRLIMQCPDGLEVDHINHN